MKKKIVYSLLGAFPIALFAFSTGPPVKRTGAAIDGGINCTACHSTYGQANSDSRGSVAIQGSSYTPGVKQTIRVSVKHPEALRWGFQLIARLASDQSKQAGTFTVDDIVRVRCETGDAPCNGGLGFAEQVSAPRTAAGDGYTFNVTWTPPATDVGNVILYAAGNAANGDGTFLGDRIYTTIATVTPNRPCVLTQKPAVTGVQNGGSFQSVIGPGAMISLFGTGFQGAGIARATGASDYVNNKFPVQVNCLAVEVNGTRIPITYSSEKQINAQAPFSLNPGSTIVRVLANPDLTNQLMSDAVTVTAQTLSPGFFTFSSGAVAATVVNSATPIGDSTVIPGSVAAKPGDVVTLWLTGLGATNPAASEGSIATAATPIAGTINLQIGGIPVPSSDMLYAGLSPNSITGLYQINVRLPAALPDGKATVSLDVNGAKAQDGLALVIKRQ